MPYAGTLIPNAIVGVGETRDACAAIMALIRRSLAALALSICRPKRKALARKNYLRGHTFGRA